MTTSTDLATQNRINWQTREDRVILAALDFTPTVPCESNIGGEHDHAAEWVLTLSCGHTGAVCTPIKDRALTIPDDKGYCPICGADPATITRVERIGK